MARKVLTWNESIFLRETIEKERDSQLRFYLKQKAAGKELAECGKSKQYQVLKRRLELNSPQVNEGMLQRLKNLKPVSFRRTKNVPSFDIDKFIQREKDGTNMRSPSPDTKKNIYDGISHDCEGRYKYLKKRNDKDPEEKFVFPEVSSWDYGWNLSQVIKREDMKKPTYGRTTTAIKSFYDRNGITFTYPPIEKKTLY